MESLMTEMYLDFKKYLGLLGGASQICFGQDFRQKCVWTCSTLIEKGINLGEPVWLKKPMAGLWGFPSFK